MEPIARKKYEEISGKKVHLCGVVVRSDQPFICATPDGLVETDTEIKVLEIKCPSRNVGDKIQVDYLVDGKLSQKSTYYDQVQLQLYVTGLSSADLFIFSTQDYKIVNVPRDEKFL